MVEEISEELKRESEEENAKDGAMIFGYDVSNMSTSMKFVYLGFVFAFFGLIFHFLSSKLFENEQGDPIKKRREEILKRKAKWFIYS